MGNPIRPCLFLVLFATTVGAQAERPLPDQAEFLQAVRSNLQTDRALQSRYAYLEKRTDVQRDDRGTETGRTEKVFDVYPALKGTDTYRRLISENGAAPDAASLEVTDRLRQNAIRDHEQQIRSETPEQRHKRLREEAEERRKEDAIIDDAFQLYRFQLTGRETLDGHDAIVATFAPVPGVTPRTREGKLLQKFSGRAWVAERDHQLMRLEVESLDDVSFGLGLLARIHKGSRMVFQRRPLTGDGVVWLPSELRYSGGGRVLLVKKLRVEKIREYSNYRALSLEGAPASGNEAALKGRATAQK